MGSAYSMSFLTGDRGRPIMNARSRILTDSMKRREEERERERRVDTEKKRGRRVGGLKLLWRLRWAMSLVWR